MLGISACDQRVADSTPPAPAPKAVEQPVAESAPPTPPPVKANQFEKLDADKNGAVALEEYKARSKKPDADARFAKIDADKNGTVSLEEWSGTAAKTEEPAAEEPSAPAAEVAVTFRRPPFSWDTVPIYQMFGDGKRLLTDAELKIVAASSDFICIEKSHGLKKLRCARLGAAREIERFKKIDPKMFCLFYFNSAYAFPFSKDTGVFGAKVVEEPFRSFLIFDPKTGEPKRRGAVRMYDVLNPEFRTWWAETVGKGVRETGADGVFVDQMHGNVFSRRKQKNEVDAAQAEMMRMAKKAIGPEKILLLNGVDEDRPDLFEIGDAFMFEHANAARFLTKEAIVKDWDDMKKIAAAGKISVWRIGVNKEAKGAKLVSEADLEKFSRERLSYYLAAFLIGAQPYSYFQYGWGWTLQDGALVDYPEFSKPLGAPKAEATRPDPAAWIFTREFEKASVRVDLATGQGEIHWH